MAVKYLVPDGQHLPYTDDAGNPSRKKCGEAWAALHKGFRGNKYQGPNKAQAIARLRAIYKSKGWPLPGDDGDDDAAHSARFAADLPIGGVVPGSETVTRTGLIFRAGEYEPQKFKMTPEELIASAQAFSDPVPVELEHVNSSGLDTILDGKLGHLTAVWPSEDGAEMYGDVEVPAWLDPIWSQHGSKCSLVFDRESKRIQRIGAVLTPAVSDAALLSGYATFARKRHDTRRGQMAMQDLHDTAVRYGAVCNQPAAMASRHEYQVIQQAHDIATEHGAMCDTVQTGMPPGLNPLQYTFSQSKGKKMDWKGLWGGFFSAAQDMDGQVGDAQSAAGQQINLPSPNGNVSTGYLPSQVTITGTAPIAPFAAQPDPEVARLKAEQEANNKALAEVRAALAVETEKRIQSEAAAFADAEIAAGRIMPAERESTIAVFAQAARDDQSGPVTLSDNTKTSRVELLRAQYATRQAHGLTTERMPGGQAPEGGSATLSNQGQTPQTDPNDPKGKAVPLTEDRRVAMLSATPQGKVTLERLRKNGQIKA